MGALMMRYVNLHTNLPVLHLKCNSCSLQKKQKRQLVNAFFRFQSDKFVQSGPFLKRLFPTKTWRAQAIWLMTISRCRLGGAGARFATTDLDCDLKEQNYCPVWNISPDIFHKPSHSSLSSSGAKFHAFFLKLKINLSPLSNSLNI